jgi:hypothetical protein
VAQRCDLASPKVAAGAGLHGHGAWGLGSEKGEDLTSSEAFMEYDGAARVGAVSLKHCFR